MVRNSRGHLRRSTACKTNAGSQISALKDLTLMDDPVQKETPALPQEADIPPGEGQPGFPDSVYLLAAAIFQNAHQEKPAARRLVNYGKQAGLHLPEVKDEEMQRTAYGLAFDTLKYQELLEDIMIDSCFYLAQPMPDDQMSLVAVMLHDFQDRKFLPRERRGEEFIQEVRDVEDCLHRFRTKLAASLARCRIKHDLLTIDCILPERVRRNQERASCLPLYAWVNTLKSSLDEVQGVLKRAGFSQVKSIRQLQGQTYCRDVHCEDTLAFPARLRADLYRTELLGHHKLIIQDKSCGLGPHAVRHLLSGEGDVLMAGSFSGLTVSHAASLIDRGDDGKDRPRVFACVGDRAAVQGEELREAVARLGCKNVKLIPQVFQSLDGDDARLQKVRVILLTPQCSVSAVSNPVDFILQENGDQNLLQDLSQGSIAQSKLEALVAQQKKDIDHALKFPKVGAVVYTTCSSYPEENEEVLSRALEQADTKLEEEPKLRKFRPNVSLPGSLGLAADSEVTAPFFRLEPSEESNGCFLAILTREPEPVVEETAQEVLARANAKGLLDKIGTKQPTRKERRGCANRTARATDPRASLSLPRASAGNRSKVNPSWSRETKGGVPAPVFGQQRLADRRLLPRGKAEVPYWEPSRSTACSSVNRLISSAASITGHHLLNPSTSGLASASSSSSSSTLHPAPPPSAPVGPVGPVGPTPRGRYEVLRPVALTLPPVQFPNFHPPKHSRTGASNLLLSHYKWRPEPAPLIRSSGSLNKEFAVKPRPWL
ncbi:putative methyltransferase NSUN7 [Polymixia lowei]